MEQKNNDGYEEDFENTSADLREIKQFTVDQFSKFNKDKNNQRIEEDLLLSNYGNS